MPPVFTLFGKPFSNSSKRYLFLASMMHELRSPASLFPGPFKTFCLCMVNPFPEQPNSCVVYLFPWSWMGNNGVLIKTSPSILGGNVGEKWLLDSTPLNTGALICGIFSESGLVGTYPLLPFSIIFGPINSFGSFTSWMTSPLKLWALFSIFNKGKERVFGSPGTSF